MSNEDQATRRTSEFPAIGASGAIGILPNGFFAKKLSGVESELRPTQTHAPQVEERKQPDRG